MPYNSFGFQLSKNSRSIQSFVLCSLGSPSFCFNSSSFKLLIICSLFSSNLSLNLSSSDNLFKGCFLMLNLSFHTCFSICSSRFGFLCFLLSPFQSHGIMSFNSFKFICNLCLELLSSHLCSFGRSFHQILSFNSGSSNDFFFVR
jgi:hypothetical protein